MPPFVIQLHAHDNVAVAARDLPSGQAISLHGDNLVAKALVPLGHKIAVTDIAEGEPILKYGFPIGYASQPIARGEWVHGHNVTLGARSSDYAFASETPPPRAAGGSHFRGLSPRGRPSGYAKLHRRHLDSQLLGVGRQVHRPAGE